MSAVQVPPASVSRNWVPTSDRAELSSLVGLGSVPGSPGFPGRVHLHMLFLDGAYRFSSNWASFHRAARPDHVELTRLLDTLSRRIVRVLERRGLLIAKILGHAQQRAALNGALARAPPGHQQETFNLI